MSQVEQAYFRGNASGLKLNASPVLCRSICCCCLCTLSVCNQVSSSIALSSTTPICHQGFVLWSQQQNCVYSVLLHLCSSAKGLLGEAGTEGIVQHWGGARALYGDPLPHAH